MSAIEWVSGGGVTLSTENTTDDTATSTGAGYAYGGSSGGGQTSGLWYFEGGAFDFTPITTSGIGITSSDLSQNMLGNANDAIHGSQGGSGSASWAGLLSGYVYGVAYDLTNSWFWVGPVGLTNGSMNSALWTPLSEPLTWNGSSSNAPGVSGGVGGLATGTFTDTMYPLFYNEENSGTAVVLTTTAAYCVSPIGVPAGFTAIGGPGTPRSLAPVDTRRNRTYLRR